MSPHTPPRNTTYAISATTRHCHRREIRCLRRRCHTFVTRWHAHCLARHYWKMARDGRRWPCLSRMPPLLLLCAIVTAMLCSRWDRYATIRRRLQRRTRDCCHTISVVYVVPRAMPEDARCQHEERRRRSCRCIVTDTRLLRC